MTPADKILAARTALLWDHPFFGALAIGLQTVNATSDPSITTMATDGTHLFYDDKFVAGLSKEELMFVLAHEVLHNAFEHHIRRQDREPGKFNKACDYAINGELVATGVGKMPVLGLIDPHFTGLGAEQIYNMLPDEDGDGSSSGDGSGSGSGSSADPGGCGGVLDAAPSHDTAALSKARAEMQTKVRMAANLAKAANQGTLPAAVQRIVDSLLKPKVDWRAVLRRFVDESVTRDFSWARPNRRLLPHGFITPGTIADGVPHVSICVDTSGSIDDEILGAFAAEVRGALDEGAVDAITVVYCDAAVGNVDNFERGDELALHPTGGGGTRFSPALRYVREKRPDTKAIIYLTDLHCSDFGQDPSIPVLWGVYGRDKDFDSLATPFGELIQIQENL